MYFLGTIVSTRSPFSFTILYIDNVLTQVLLNPVKRRGDISWPLGPLLTTHVYTGVKKEQITNALFQLPQNEWLFSMNTVGGYVFINLEHSYNRL